jgi:DNA-binding transcriptional regulator YiaG
MAMGWLRLGYMAEKTAVEIARIREMAANGQARAIRERARLSQADIAGDINVDSGTIARWEAGIRSPRGTAALRYGRLLQELSEVAP